MKDVSATLRRIDEEITAHNQQIARCRVEISRLQETRAVLMQIAEDDIVAAQMVRTEARGVINGEHAKPVLIVRKMGSDEPGQTMHEASGLNASGNKRGMNNPRAKKPPKPGKVSHKGTHAGTVKRVLETLSDATEPMSTKELAHYFGMPPGDKARQPLYNALYVLRKEGRLRQDEAKRYFLPQ